MSGLSNSQLKCLAILPSIAGPLSVLGSSGILYHILVVKKRSERRLYHRLLMGTSCFDILSSSWQMLGPLPVNIEAGGFVGRGNVATCTAMGFFLHMSLGVILYNVCMMGTFLAMVRYGVREERIADRYERWMHGVCAMFPFWTGRI